jgi:hypothetical protein
MTEPTTAARAALPAAAVDQLLAEADDLITADNTSTRIDLLRDEIKTLKDEQRDRIKQRDSLIYSVIVAVAAVAGGTRLAGAAVPLLLPPVTLLLGWTYLTNDQMVSAIGRHLRTQLAPRLAALAGTEVLLWENTRLVDRRYRQRKTIQLAVDLIAFVAPALVAVVWFWAHGPANPVLLAVSIVETAAALIGAWQIVSYAERRTTSLDTRPVGTDVEATR